jgi:hypothetical protein
VPDQDPEMMREAQKMMNDPAFQAQVNKVTDTPAFKAHMQQQQEAWKDPEKVKEMEVMMQQKLKEGNKMLEETKKEQKARLRKEKKKRGKKKLGDDGKNDVDVGNKESEGGDNNKQNAPVTEITSEEDEMPDIPILNLN